MADLYPTIAGREGWFRIGTEPGQILIDTNDNLGALAGNVSFLPGCSIKHFENVKVGRRVVIPGHYVSEIPKLQIVLAETNLSYLAMLKGDSYSAQVYKSKDYKRVPEFNLKVYCLRTPKFPDAQTDEDLGDADDSTKTFSGTLAYLPERGTLEISDDSTSETFEDTNADGTLVGDAGGTGTIDYNTGAYSVTFNTAPASPDDIIANYTACRPVRRKIEFYRAVIDSDVPSEITADDENPTYHTLTFIAACYTQGAVDAKLYEIEEEFADA